MFICFDIMFEDPAARLVRETGVKDFIFSTAWFSEIPLLAGKILYNCTYCAIETEIVEKVRYLVCVTKLRSISRVSADSVQAGWAYTNDVNLIAAGYSAPAMCGGGSGIYAGRDGPLVMFMPDRPGTHIILSRVLKRQFHDCGGRLQTKRCPIDNSYLTFMSDYLVVPYGKEKSPPNRNRPSDLR